MDATTGDVFALPDTTSFNQFQNLTHIGGTPQNPEVRFRLDSNLLIIKTSSKLCSYLLYYLLIENRWVLLKKAQYYRTEFFILLCEYN
jgi:hypothetical protein